MRQGWLQKVLGRLGRSVLISVPRLLIMALCARRFRLRVFPLDGAAADVGGPLKRKPRRSHNAAASRRPQLISADDRIRPYPQVTTRT
jgi:hypothetical protein